MNIIYTCLHDINIDENLCIRKQVSEEDASEYSKNLIKEILENPNRKLYKTTSDRKEVVSIILESISDALVKDENADLISSRLLEKERQRQKDIEQLRKEIKRGSLFQSLLKEEDCFYYILSKIETNDFLDIQDLCKKSGLPYKDKTFKNCLFKVSEDGEILNIFLSDKNGAIANYWYNLFLELEELTSDESNTLKLFNIINSKLKAEIEPISPSEYTLYRNRTLGYFQTQKTFNMDNYFNYTFGDNPIELNLINIDKVKEKITNKVNNMNSDTEFNIVSTAITSRKLRETKKINNVTSLTIEGFDEEIKTNVQSVEENGEKYIKIKATDTETFNRFKW